MPALIIEVGGTLTGVTGLTNTYQPSTLDLPLVSADISSLMRLAGKLQRPDRAQMIMSAAAESHMLSYLSIVDV